MANFYKGSEIKFAINLTAEGFSMDADDFDIEVASGKSTVKGYKGGSHTGTDVIIFNEGDSSGEDGGTWYAIVKTDQLAKGDMRVIATAHIPDANASGGTRNEIAVATLGTLMIP